MSWLALKLPYILITAYEWSVVLFGGGGVPGFVIATSGVVVAGLGGPPSVGSMAGSHSPLSYFYAVAGFKVAIYINQGL